MNRRAWFTLIGFAWAGLVAGWARAADPVPADNFVHQQAGHQVKVWFHAPADLAADAPVVVVLHGVGRNGEEYFHDWLPLAVREKFLLVVPEFSNAEFPGEAGYNLGHMIDAAGGARPREAWAFSMIEPIFDEACRRTGNRSRTYALYGHSAGAQFVHRFLYFVPQARVSRVVVANSGWYTLPDLTVAFPYGLKGTPVTAADLRGALARPVTILLGERDIDPQAKSLRQTPGAVAQGPNRFTRGHYFFQYAQSAAAAQHHPLGWSLATVPDIDHSNKGMAPHAVPRLLKVSAHP
jgi:poly(3-hydroxybutyrate) depolymerase